MAFPPKSMADFGEFGKLFADMKLPALPDMEAFVSASRRNMETLTAANRVALEGAQAVARRHMEIVQQSMAELTEAVRALSSVESPQAKAAKQAELLKQAYEHAVGNLKEIWPQILEKAVANLNGGYNSIADGGFSVVAMVELTGQAATYVTPAQLTLAALVKDVAAGDLITFDTVGTGGLADNLVTGHCYMFQKINGSGASATGSLLNPWGMDQPSAIAFSSLAKVGIAEINIGHVG